MQSDHKGLGNYFLEFARWSARKACSCGRSMAFLSFFFPIVALSLCQQLKVHSSTHYQPICLDTLGSYSGADMGANNLERAKLAAGVEWKQMSWAALEHLDIGGRRSDAAPFLSRAPGKPASTEKVWESRATVGHTLAHNFACRSKRLPK